MYANGNIGLNGNQNHTREGKRISTRVLAPPGGGSSFSIGGYCSAPSRAEPTSYGYGQKESMQNAPYRRKSSDSQPHRSQGGSSSESYSYGQNIRKRHENEQEYDQPRRQPRKSYGGGENRSSYRDSLDEQMVGHNENANPSMYNGVPKSNYAHPSRSSDYDHNNQRIVRSERQQPAHGSLRKEDYAELLRQQIDAKRDVDTGAKIGAKMASMRKNCDYDYDSQSYRHRDAAPIISGRRGANPSAARTSFSLGWE